MIIPSIDVMQGQAVQLVGGQTLELTAGDPRAWARQLGLVGSVAVVDLDAALGRGSNSTVIRELLSLCRCRVGGGIRSPEQALAWLDAGAESVVLGTAAHPDILRQLPRDRVIAALDTVQGEVVVEGWQRGTGRGVLERIRELREWVSGFLVTFVECEGRLQGTRMDLAREIAQAAGGRRVTVAGGISSMHEIAELDRWGCDAQVGMALYRNRLTLADAFSAPLVSDRPDGLWPTVVVDEQERALGLAYSSRASLAQAFEERRGVFFSRRRGELWVKGQQSGATQELLEVAADCDRDTLRFRVRQNDPGFCHQATWTCWGPSQGVAGLARKLASRLKEGPAESYTRRLADDPCLLRAKLQEEARELALASDSAAVAAEAADLIYFALTRLAVAGVSLGEVEKILDARQRRVTRRGGDAKLATE